MTSSGQVSTVFKRPTMALWMSRTSTKRSMTDKSGAKFFLLSNIASFSHF